MIPLTLIKYLISSTTLQLTPEKLNYLREKRKMGELLRNNRTGHYTQGLFSSSKVRRAVRYETHRDEYNSKVYPKGEN